MKHVLSGQRLITYAFRFPDNMAARGKEEMSKIVPKFS